jgi:hypothetical protein
MLFISTGIFDDKLHPNILSVAPTANAPLTDYQLKGRISWFQLFDDAFILVSHEDH